MIYATLILLYFYTLLFDIYLRVQLAIRSAKLILIFNQNYCCILCFEYVTELGHFIIGLKLTKLSYK